MTRWPSKRALEQAAEFQAGIAWGWIRFKCRRCGSDYCTRLQPIIYDPCPTCGTHVGYIEKVTIRR